MTFGQFITFEAMKSQIEVPCGITDGPGAPVHTTHKYMFVRLFPQGGVDKDVTRLTQEQIQAGLGFGENTERSAAEIKICPSCFGQLLYKMTDAAKMAQFLA